MSNEALAVMLGAAIGIIGSNASTLLVVFLSNRKRAKSIRIIAHAEINEIEEKADRYIKGHSTFKELRASTPMLTSIAAEIGFLYVDQAVAFREAVTLDTEMREQGTKEKTAAVVTACQHAARLFADQASIHAGPAQLQAKPYPCAILAGANGNRGSLIDQI